MNELLSPQVVTWALTAVFAAGGAMVALNGTRKTAQRTEAKVDNLSSQMTDLIRNQGVAENRLEHAEKEIEILRQRVDR